LLALRTFVIPCKGAACGTQEEVLESVPSNHRVAIIAELFDLRAWSLHKGCTRSTKALVLVLIAEFWLITVPAIVLLDLHDDVSDSCSSRVLVGFDAAIETGSLSAPALA
jgi:hypothetical protein